MPKRPSSLYAARVRENELAPDAGQQAVLAHLDELCVQLEGYKAASGGSGGLGWIFNRKSSGNRPRPVYVWGDVGRGKTMVMDLFHEAIAPDSKLRVHFHAFMQDVHGQIFKFRESQKSGLIAASEDPIRVVAKNIVEKASVLCLDEFQVKDITDAMILGRLFEALLGAGCVIVATSNIPPGELYKNGLNRNLFEPFIELINKRFEVLELDGGTDYRLDKLAGEDVYFCPLGPGATSRMKLMWRKVTGGDGGEERWLEVGKRRVRVPSAARGAAWFSFADLCDEPLGNGDYLKIAENFHTLFVEGVRELTKAEGNAARRLINLIDTAYDQHLRVVMSADTPPEGIYRFSDTPVEFARTVSRLNEMQSQGWWETGADSQG